MIKNAAIACNSYNLFQFLGDCDGGDDGGGDGSDDIALGVCSPILATFLPLLHSSIVIQFNMMHTLTHTSTRKHDRTVWSKLS